MKKTAVLIFLSLITSCQYFDKQVPKEQELLEQELQKINWEQVDEFPSITTCDTLGDAEIRKQCFFEYITQTIQQKLEFDTIVGVNTQTDTINVMVTVFPDATLQFEPKFPEDSVAYNRIKIDSLLNVKLNDFPSIQPALKRGIPVKTQFILPVIINAE